MEHSRFHHHITGGHLSPAIIERFFGIVLLFILSPALSAQNEGQQLCNFSANATIGCDNVTVHFSGNSNWPTHQWDFGDGTPILTGGPTLYQVDHTYHDINPYIIPSPTAKHSLDGSFWCEITLQDFLPGILIGNGCLNTKTVSNLVAAGTLPANELQGKNLYVFGDLEVDIPYLFNGCNIFVRSGGKLIVKSGGALTLKNNTVADALIISGDEICQSLWNGIEVLPGGSLTTNGAIIRNAYFAISPINPGNIAPLPKLSLRNTIFQRNFVGIYAVVGSFAVSLFMNNTFEGSGNNPIYSTSSCNPPAQISGVPYSQRTYCGIYFDGSMGGSLLLAGQSTNNLIKDMQAGIVCINGTSRVTGCRFENIAFLANAPALYQGTPLTFIDNLGGKRLVFTGLGKETLLATINNCERAVYLKTTKPLTEAYVSACRMLEVQNGIEFDESGEGNFARGAVSNCYIGCTKYPSPPNIKMRSTGIEVKDPNIAYSNFSISGNDIDVDQPEAFTPNVDPTILPTGINVVAMHNQASSAGMLFDIGSNNINLIAGINGITTENVANANISGNVIIKTKESLLDVYRCISVVGGLGNTITCNIATNFPQGGPVGIPLGIVCESSLNAQISQNTVKDMASCLAVRFDNAEDCVISYNNFDSNPALIQGTGIYYFDAITGPQYLLGNDWLGDFGFGAFYEHNVQNGFLYCDSRYQVSGGANVFNPTNPVVTTMIENCGNWFTVEGTENDYICGGATGAAGILTKNEADLNLAGGGTLSLSPGYKWTSEMGLIRKFVENPQLATGDAVINGFLQAQQGQPVTAMYGVRNSINGLEGSISPALLGNIQNTLLQLDAKEAILLALVENIDTDPNALASFTTITDQTETLEQLLQSYMTLALSTMAISGATVLNTNSSINSSILPCASERNINGLYLETQVIAPRALTASELEVVGQIALNCPKDAGSIVYLARAWYYLQTGMVLDTPCGYFAPPLGGGERNSPHEEPASDLVLMPNPADNSVEVILPANLGEYTLLITDMWGRPMLQRKIPESEGSYAQTIPTEGLSTGIYLVYIRAKTGKPLTKRLTITH
ncbi:MAG: T9SS type A sorting domain-containing protein [Saprospiraceae bacterium]